MIRPNIDYNIDYIIKICNLYSNYKILECLIVYAHIGFIYYIIEMMVSKPSGLNHYRRLREDGIKMLSILDQFF